MRLAAAVLAAVAAGALADAAPEKKNLLFIVADDMRPELGIYGQSYMHTPNLDAFGKSGSVFTRAHCQMAICSASRNSFLSGRRPDRTQVWNFLRSFRDNPDGVHMHTLPQYLKNHGYTTLGAGKIYHPGHPVDNDEPLSWSQDRPYCKQRPRRCDKGTMFCPVNVTEPGTPQDAEFNDYNMTQCAISNLKYAAAKANPFAIFLGLHFPHLSHRVPLWAVRKYMPGASLQPNASGTIAPATNRYAPKGMPDIAFTQEIDGMTNVSIPVDGVSHQYEVPSPINDTFPEWFDSTFRLGYRSAITLTDYHVGLMLKALEDSGHADDTVVVVISDHGWKTGEHRLYAKHTEFELDTRVTMMMRVPWKPASHGAMVDSLTELQDLYPTIASLLGLPPPRQRIDGDDVSALFDNPTQRVKQYAFSQYDRCPEADEPVYFHPNCEEVKEGDIAVMGYGVRDDNWRLTHWYKWNGTSLTADFAAGPMATELYDHTGDDGLGDWERWENENVAAANPDVVSRLTAVLLDHYDAPLDDDDSDDATDDH